MDNIRFRKSETLIERNIEGEAILLDIKSGVYYDLKEVGVFIWEMLGGGATALEISAAVTENFEVSPADALADAVELLKDLETEGLIVRVPEG